MILSYSKMVLLILFPSLFVFQSKLYLENNIFFFLEKHCILLIGNISPHMSYRRMYGKQFKIENSLLEFVFRHTAGNDAIDGVRKITTTSGGTSYGP